MQAKQKETGWDIDARLLLYADAIKRTEMLTGRSASAPHPQPSDAAHARHHTEGLALADSLNCQDGMPTGLHIKTRCVPVEVCLAGRLMLKHLRGLFPKCLAILQQECRSNSFTDMMSLSRQEAIQCYRPSRQHAPQEQRPACKRHPRRTPQVPRQACAGGADPPGGFHRHRPLASCAQD